METVSDFIFLGSKIITDGDFSHEIKRCLLLGKKSHEEPRQHIKKQRHSFAHKGPSSQGYGFSGSYVWMLELDHKESWVLKNSCFWTVVLEKTIESPLNCKEIKPVNPKGNQLLEELILMLNTNTWSPDVKNWIVGKDLDAGKDWRQEEKGMTEDKMVGWHHWSMDMSLSKLQEIVKDKEV